MFNTSHDVDIFPQFTLYVLFWCKLYWSRSFWQCKTMHYAHPIWSPNCRGHGLSRGRRGGSFSWEIWNFWTVPWKPADATLAGSEGSLSRKYFIDIGGFNFHKVVFTLACCSSIRYDQMCSLCLVSYLHVRDYLNTRRKNINLKKSVQICKHSSSTSQEADYGRSELLTGLPLRCHVSTWGRVQLKGASNWLWSECWLAMTFKDTFPHEAFIRIPRRGISRDFEQTPKAHCQVSSKSPQSFFRIMMQGAEQSLEYVGAILMTSLSGPPQEAVEHLGDCRRQASEGTAGFGTHMAGQTRPEPASPSAVSEHSDEGRCAAWTWSISASSAGSIYLLMLNRWGIMSAPLEGRAALVQGLQSRLGSCAVYPGALVKTMTLMTMLVVVFYLSNTCFPCKSACPYAIYDYMVQNAF